MKTRSHSLQLLIWGTAIPFVLLISLAAIFLMNNRPPKITVPTPKMPADNGWDDFVRAGEMIGTTRHFGPFSQTRPVGSWTIPEYESFVKDNAAALALVRKGLTKEYLHPPIRDFMGPLYAPHREIARTLAGEAKYYQVIGKPGKAVDSLLDCLEFGAMIPKGGNVITALVGGAIESIGGSHIHPLLSELNPQELQHVGDRLEKIQEKRVTFSKVMNEEADGTAAAFADLFTGEEHLASVRNPKNWFTEDFTGASSTSKVEVAWLNMRYAFANKSASVRAAQTYYEAIAKEQSGVYTGITRVAECTAPIPMLGPKFYLQMRSIIEKNTTFVGLIQTEVALRRYKADHGRYPGRLTELVPIYLKSLPIDPFGKGKTFKYKPLNNGKDFLLYSLGPNLKDDGGKQGKWGGLATPGDLVAGEKWTR